VVQWIKLMDIAARRTKMGAETHLEVAKVKRGKIKVVKYDKSKTGNHWREALLATPEAEGYVNYIDISNSGHHRCKILHVVNGRVEIVYVAEDVCHLHEVGNW